MRECKRKLVETGRIIRLAEGRAVLAPMARFATAEDEREHEHGCEDGCRELLRR
jgi:hypothetical protein